MVNYMRAELYKVLHRKYTYGFLLVILLCEALLVAGWAYTNANGNDVNFSSGAGILGLMLGVGLYCTMLTGDMVFSDQYKFNTLKNEVSYGLPRARIYLGKLVVACITALVLCAIVLCAYVAMCWAVLPHDTGAAETMSLIYYCILTALPLWLGAQALVLMLYFLLKSSTVASFIFLGVILALPQVVKLLITLVGPVFEYVYVCMLTTSLDMAPYAPWDMALLGRSWAIGAGWFVITTLVGLICFQKREIN